MSEELTQREIRNALEFLIRHALTSGCIAADIPYEEHARRVDAAVKCIFETGSQYGG